MGLHFHVAIVAFGSRFCPSDAAIFQACPLWLGDMRIGQGFVHAVFDFCLGVPVTGFVFFLTNQLLVLDHNVRLQTCVGNCCVEWVSQLVPNPVYMMCLPGLLLKFGNSHFPWLGSTNTLLLGH